MNHILYRSPDNIISPISWISYWLYSWQARIQGGVTGVTGPPLGKYLGVTSHLWPPPPILYLRYICWLAKLSDVDNKSPSKISTSYSEIVCISTTLVYSNRYLFTKLSSQHRLFSKRAQFILVDLASQNLISNLLGNLKTKSLYLYDWAGKGGGGSIKQQ